VTVLADFSQSPRLRHLQLVATKAVNKQLAQHLKRKGKYNTRPSPASRSRNMSLTVNVCLLQCRLLTSSDTSRLYRSAACMTEPVYCCNNCYKINIASLMNHQVMDAEQMSSDNSNSTHAICKWFSDCDTV